jgi:hypothetical protein
MIYIIAGVAVASFVGGWYCKGKFGAKADAIVKAVNQ